MTFEDRTDRDEADSRKRFGLRGSGRLLSRLAIHAPIADAR